MEYVIFSLLVIAGIALVLRPLVGRGKYRFEPEDTFALGDMRQLNYLNAEKTAILENIKELDFEHEMGKLSEEDYSRLRNDYLRETQEVVAAIDRLKIQEEIEELIESDVRNRRRIK
jgi:hypothetical protein